INHVCVFVCVCVCECVFLCLFDVSLFNDHTQNYVIREYPWKRPFAGCGEIPFFSFLSIFCLFCIFPDEISTAAERASEQPTAAGHGDCQRSEEHTSELQS